MSVSSHFNKAAYRKQLERKNTSKLIEILRENGQLVNYKSDKKALIDQILNLPDKTRIRAEKKSGMKIKKSDIKKVVLRFIFTLIIIIIIAQVISNFSYYIGVFRSNKLTCTNSKRAKKNRYPPNSICVNGELRCIENFSRVKGLCLPNRNDSNQLLMMIEFSKNKLKSKAGKYKCQKARVDWVSIDEIGSMLRKSIHPQKRNNFNDLFNLTIDFLMKEPNIITRNIEDSLVFVSADYILPLTCQFKSIIVKYIFIIFLAIVINIIYIFIHINSIQENPEYERQSEQHLRTVVKFIKSFNGNEVSQSQVKTKLQPMVDNPEAVMRYVKKKLKKSSSIGIKKEGGDVYFYSKE